MPSFQLFIIIVFVIACILMCWISFVSRRHLAHAGGLMLEVPMWGSGLIVSVCVPELISHLLLIKT